MQIAWYRAKDYSILLIAVVFASLLLGRFLHVFALGRCFNLTRRPETRLTWRMQLLLAWSGLRGAVAFTLSLQTPKGFDFEPPTDIHRTHYDLSQSLSLNCTCDTTPVTPELQNELQRQSDVHAFTVTTTLVIVFATIFLFGGLTSPLLNWLALAGEENVPSKYVLF
jgi:NhaP-type Na+/H+ or K+/H+ antiporter